MDEVSGQSVGGSFGQVLRDSRNAARLTQEELAELARFSVRAIRNLERGRTRRPYRRSAQVLADALRLTGHTRDRFLAAAHGSGWASGSTDGNSGTPPPAQWDASIRQRPRQPEFPVLPRQLPSAVADFIGRSPQISRLTAALALGAEGTGVSVTVISGQPGVGKTALALRVAHSIRSSFPDGQLWVQLAGASARPRDPGEMLGELLRALGMLGSAIPDATAERAALYRSRLADRRVLLVADDAGSAAQVRPLLPGTAGSAVVVTSRARLPGVPGATLLELDPFTPSEAVGLLTRIVGDQRVKAEQEAARELAGACDLVPLAVRIAGAKLATRPSWPLSLLHQRMVGERRRLDELEVEDLSVRASFALSYQGLHEQAKRLFRLLGLLGPHDFAEWVFAALLSQPDASVPVNELVDKSLLTPTGIDVTGQARYRLHDLLREYARERLADEPAQQRELAMQRALGAWQQLAELADQALPSDPFFAAPACDRDQTAVPAGSTKKLISDPIAWFTAERLNLLDVTERACSNGWYERAYRMALCQARFQHLQDRNDDSTQIWREVLHAAECSEDRIAIANAALRYAAALIQCGQAVNATDLLDRSVEQFERSGDLSFLAFALYWRGACSYDLGHYHLSARDSKRGVALSLRIGNRHSELLNLRTLGQSYAYLERYDEGVSICERALSVAKEIGDSSYKIAAMHTLAFVCNLAGQYERAAKLCWQRLDLSRQVADLHGESLALGMLGDSYRGLGRYREAAQMLSAALSIFRDHASRRFQGLCLLKLGYTHIEMGQHRQAAGYLKDSLLIFRELRLSHFEEKARAALSGCH